MVNNNAQNLIKQILSSGNTIGLLQAKDVGGTIRYIADFTAYPSVVEDTFTLNAADPGISVGSSTTTPTASDYQLGNTITSGLTAIISTTNTVDENDNSSIIFNITITNTSSSNIEISEIGYKQEISASDSLNGTTVTDRVFLLDRSTFDTITLAPNGQAVLNYSLKAAVSNSGGVVGSKNINTNGVYNAIDDSLDGYSTVVVNVPSASLDTKTITQNGTYDAEDDNLDGYSSVVVNVSGGSGSFIKIYDITQPDASNLDDVFTFTCPSAGKIVVADFAYANGATLTIDGVTYDSYQWSRYYFSINGIYDVNANSTVVLHTYGSGNCGIDAKVYFVSDNQLIGTKIITSNGTYLASEDSLEGYSVVTVNTNRGIVMDSEAEEIPLTKGVANSLFSATATITAEAEEAVQ